MSRAERRRAQKCEQKAKTATYNLTRAQLDALVREKISGELDRVKQEATNDAINQAMILLLTLPLEVLMDHYWPKSYAKRIPEFTEHVLEYYEKWQNDELDMDKLKGLEVGEMMTMEELQKACEVLAKAWNEVLEPMEKVVEALNKFFKLYYENEKSRKIRTGRKSKSVKCVPDSKMSIYNYKPVVKRNLPYQRRNF